MLTETARSRALAYYLAQIKTKVEIKYRELIKHKFDDEETLTNVLLANIHQDVSGLISYVNAFKGIHVKQHNGEFPSTPKVTVSVDEGGCLGIEITQWEEPQVEDQQKYGWAGNVFDYLDMYDADVEAVLGVKQVNLYPGGIREAVTLCFKAADQFEDKHKAESFKGYVLNQVLHLVEDLTKKYELSKQFMDDVGTLHNKTKLHIDHANAPTGYLESLTEEQKAEVLFTGKQQYYGG